MERKKLELIRKLQGLGKEGHIDDVKKEIREADAERRGLSIRIFLLSWLGAVILPSMFLVISLVCAVVGLNSEILSQDVNTQGFLQQQLLIFSLTTLATGFSVLLLVIRTIDSAAMNIPMPKFDVYFENLAKTLKCKRKEKSMVRFCVRNVGEDSAEDVVIIVCFPPAFEIHIAGYATLKQGPETDHPNCNSLVIQENKIHPETIPSWDAQITAPDDKNTYDVFVDIYETKSGHTEHKLNIETVD